jgi:periplasmic protein CpxP/Spy
MTSLSSRIAMLVPFTRSVAIAALMGTTILTIPMTAARADSTTKAAIQMAQAAAPKAPAAAAATETKGETVEQRITTLHAALKITSEEDAKWNAVAQAMRENATAMDKLIAETRTTPPQTMTAVDDLKMYQKFSEAHVTGLKNLIASFTTLYDAMPDAQKKNADVGFQTSGHQAAAAHS